ncbi:hypothetical protein QFC22_005849 [Naganishia vaughanmartiniae]|uniref:Uncharacterized protein n=1 Tax=Naganishia vaughanmartiniae TaxID=1424756 RepID=A0ACC2WS94_9TREE|nr:hypothetical protein QFC22_005849 [Naganishia vaughanmartiniae]
MAESLRSSARRAQNPSSHPPTPGLSTKTGKRGTKRGPDGAPLAPAAMVDEDEIKQSLGFVWEDVGTVNEGKKDVDVDGEVADSGALGKKDKQRLLAVLTALSLPPDGFDIHDDTTAAAFAVAKKRARFMQLILDQAFLPPSEDGQSDSKPATESMKTEGARTLRSMLTREEKVERDGLLSHINALSVALVPDVPEPFPSTSHHTAITTPAPTPNTRISGSRAKPVKDAVLIDTLSTVRDVIKAILSPHHGGAKSAEKVDEEEGEKGHDTQKDGVLQWALHQRLAPPQTAAARGKGTMAGLGGDWFSGLAEVRDVVPASAGATEESKMQVEDKEEEDESVMIRMERARAFGNADVVILPRNDDVQHTGATRASAAQPPPPKLGDILFVHPSRVNGSHQWEDRRRPKPARKSLVQHPRYATTFTPSFAPTHDSSAAANEWGYFSTWDAACSRAGLGRWRSTRWGKSFKAAWEDAKEALDEDEDENEQDLGQVELLDRPRATKREIAELLGSLLPSSGMEKGDETHDTHADDVAMEIDPALVDAVDGVQEDMRALQARLDQNALWVRQLQAFQEVRVRTGQRTPMEEEERVAQKLQRSLLQLASATTPAALLPRTMLAESQSASVPLAIILARKVIHISGPNVRGTLDPARPKAMVDNTTAVGKPPGQIAPAPAPVPTNVRASPAPTMSGRGQTPRGSWAGHMPVQQRTPSGNGLIPQSPAGMYAAPPQAAKQASRYTFPPQSNPAGMRSSYPTNPATMGGRSSPIAPLNSVPSVLRNALPHPVGVGSFSPMGRSTLAPTSGNPASMSMMTPTGTGMMPGNSVGAMYAGGGVQQGQGRGIGSSMGISMNNPGIGGGSPAPAFRPSNSMRGSG